MNQNSELIKTFYIAFKSGDYKTMQNCYADNAVFNDEVFKGLNSAQVRCMWEMLLKRSKDLNLEFKNIKADEFRGSAEWIATYTFSATKQKVVNNISAYFEFENGKILNHTDRFNFYKWARQALGFKGLLLGWTVFLKKKIQEKAMKNLHEFMNKSSG